MTKTLKSTIWRQHHDKNIVTKTLTSTCRLPTKLPGNERVLWSASHKSPTCNLWFKKTVLQTSKIDTDLEMFCVCILLRLLSCSENKDSPKSFCQHDLESVKKKSSPMKFSTQIVSFSISQFFCFLSTLYSWRTLSPLNILLLYIQC